MKRGTLTHPKTLHLADELHLELWGAAGVLETLWHFAQTHARRGDIGRHSDAAIARAIGWRGDASALVEALVASRWLDRCACHRLRVHDWPTHADQAVHRTEDIKRLGFIQCYATSSEGASHSGIIPEGLQPAGSVAVTGSGTDTTDPAAKPRLPSNWSREFADDFKAAYGGSPPRQMFRQVETVAKRFGWERTRPVLCAVMAETQLDFLNLPKVLAVRVEAAGKGLVVQGRPRGVTAGNVAAARRFLGGGSDAA